MERIKLLHLISRIDIGGAEKQLLHLVSNLDKEKYDICIGYFEGQGALKKEFQDNKIKVKKFRFYGLWDILTWRQLYRYLRAERFSIVHTHGFKADLLGAVFGRLVGAPVIISTVHNQERYLNNPILKMLEKWIISSINDTIISVSNGVKRFLIRTSGIKEEKIKKVYYGIDPLNFKIDKDIRQEFGVAKDAPFIGAIGRLTEQKGHIYFIQATKRVLESFPQAKFLIVGKGKLEKKLKRLVHQLGLESNIIFAGFREDIYSVINSLDLVVHPSLWEGLGIVLLEAMALEKPIVATNIEGVTEVLKDKETGILVEPKNPEALAKGVCYLLQDSTLGKKMQYVSRMAVREAFTLQRMVKEIDEIYGELIAQRASRKIKVLQIIESTGKGGSRNHLCTLVHNLNKNIFQVEVICSTLRDKDFHIDIQKMKERGIRVITLQMRRDISLLRDLIAFFKLCFYIKRARCDIVHTHSSKAGFLGRLAARLMGVRAIIHTPHYFCFIAEDMHRVKKYFYFYLEKFAALFCDKIISVSESQRQDIIKSRLVIPSKVVTIENAVDIYRFGNNGFDIPRKKQELGLDNNSIVLGAVGILIERKGHRYLMEATSRLLKEGFDVRLIIVGEGVLHEDLENLKDNLSMDSRVKLLGFREDIPELLSLMDIFVLPSLWEGMSIALLEAMASGVPVISTEIHGAVDLIENNKRGILVKKRDIKGLVEAIRYLVSKPKEAKKMGEEAKGLIHKNYTLEKHISKMEGLYLKMLPSTKK